MRTITIPIAVLKDCITNPRKGETKLTIVVERISKPLRDQLESLFNGVDEVPVQVELGLLQGELFEEEGSEE